MLGHCRAGASTSTCSKALKTRQWQERVELPQCLIAHIPGKELMAWSMVSVIPINQPTRCNNFPSLLLDVYVRLNMFRASSCPSSGAQQLQWQPLVLPLERGGSSAVGHGRADRPNHDQQHCNKLGKLLHLVGWFTGIVLWWCMVSVILLKRGFRTV